MMTKTKGSVFDTPPFGEAKMSEELMMAMNPVADAIEACKVFFDDAGLTHTTAADLLTMAKMVMKMQQDQADVVKRTAWERSHGIGDQQDA